jgi:hypothetical protein
VVAFIVAIGVGRAAEIRSAAPQPRGGGATINSTLSGSCDP